MPANTRVFREVATSDPMRIFKGLGSTDPINWRSTTAATSDGNLGQTCYINAVLQLLFHLTGFRTPLVKVTNIVEKQHQLLIESTSTTTTALLQSSPRVGVAIDEDGASAPAQLPSTATTHSFSSTLAAQLAQVFRSKEGGNRVVSPLALKKCIGSIMERFAVNDQEDAHELLTTMLDVIAMDLESPLKDLGKIAAKRTFRDPVADNFESMFPFFVMAHLSTTGTPIRQLLLLFFKEEKLTYNCEQCPSHIALARHRISRLPRVFLIHIKRYQLSDPNGAGGKPTMKRRGDTINIAEHLDLDILLPDHGTPTELAPAAQVVSSTSTTSEAPLKRAGVVAFSDQIESSDENVSGEPLNLFEGTTVDDRGQERGVEQPFQEATHVDSLAQEQKEGPKDLLDEEAQLNWAIRESEAAASSERDRDEEELKLAMQASLQDMGLFAQAEGILDNDNDMTLVADELNLSGSLVDDKIQVEEGVKVSAMY
ncbi:Ubiquitin carboxyl-terminal hydrolase 29 [Gonapodya sp. JEL0774]|nr:Ubiquitin carboxyl-terminal hydrolase 29 [Gonapodya sp. JEL0774]